MVGWVSQSESSPYRSDGYGYCIIIECALCSAHLIVTRAYCMRHNIPSVAVVSKGWIVTRETTGDFGIASEGRMETRAYF